MPILPDILLSLKKGNRFPLASSLPSFCTASAIQCAALFRFRGILPGTTAPVHCLLLPPLLILLQPVAPDFFDRLYAKFMH